MGTVPRGGSGRRSSWGAAGSLFLLKRPQSLAAHSNRPSPPYTAGAEDLLLEPPRAQGKALPRQRDSGHLVNLVYTLR